MITQQGTNALSGKLDNIVHSLQYIGPETALAVGFLCLITLGLIFRNRPGNLAPIFALLIFFISLFLDYTQWILFKNSEASNAFLGLIKIDSVAVYFKFLFDIAGILTIALTFFYKNRLQKSLFVEYFALILGIIIGAHFMVMAVNLLMVFIAIELVSLSSYILTGFLFNKKGAEAGIKYLLFGALSTGCMIYGMSLLYGFSGTLEFNSPSFYEALAVIPKAPLLIGILLTLVGFLFKMSLVPFHLWVPDIYEATPTPIVALFSVVPKAAAFVILARFIFAHHLPQDSTIFNILAILALISMFIGNLGALWQNNIKRMLAYSSIAQAGFIAVGILANSSWGLTSMAFYITIYLIMNFGVFLIVQVLEEILGTENMQDFRGLGLQYTLLGVSMLVIMISLAGLPPTAGFLSKLFIFSALWETYQQSANPIFLVVFVLGLFNVVISLFYYLKVPFLMFFTTNSEIKSSNIGWKENISLTVLIIPLLFLFFKSEGLIQIINFIALNFN